MATEPLPDHLALRQGRRERAFDAMEAHDLDVLVLGRVANIRYVSGRADPLERRHAPVRPRLRGRARHPRDPPPQHLGRGRPRGDPARPPVRHHVEPDEPRDDAQGDRRRRRAVAVSAPTRCRPCSRSCCRWRSRDAEIVDGGPALRAARRIKTGEEVDAIRAAIAVADVAMAAAVAVLRPGVSERELTGVFMDAMASQGVTTPATQDVVRITSTRAARTAAGQHARAGGRPRGVRRRRRRRRLRRRGGPDLARRPRRAHDGGRAPLPAVGRAVGSAARRVPARCRCQRAPRRVPSGRRAAPDDADRRAAWASASTTRWSSATCRRPRRGSGSTPASSSSSPAASSTTPSDP